MKFTQFKPKHEQTILQGIVTDSGIKQIEGDMFTDWQETGTIYQPADVESLKPISPRHVVGIGANYVAGPEDLPEKPPELPVFFYKPVSSVIGSGEPIIIPEGISEVKFDQSSQLLLGKRRKTLLRMRCLIIFSAIPWPMT
ncbi:Rv2993c-like domain-containing protein [Lentibacillus sp. CBA3610]|uniref:Rv2993c-like domain-containing protein n=1 Tax=Lentibacillus sp. CBA3610 TaxID=2518176 RepID=UPI0020D205F5|nr:Rv2993c-like domain-containing protein [Lentibacillus sp. CBA3610]